MGDGQKGTYTTADVASAPRQTGQYSAADVASGGSDYSGLAQKYGLPVGTDLSKPYLQQDQSLKIDPMAFSRAYSEAHPEPAPPTGFWSNVYNEAKNLFHGATSPGLSVTDSGLGRALSTVEAAKQNPVSAIPIVGPIAVARGQQVNRGDIAGALGAGLTDTLSLAAPLILGRMGLGETATAEEESPHVGVGSAPAAETNPAQSVGAASRVPIAVASEQAKGAVGKFAQTLGISDGPPEDLMTRAIKPRSNNTGWGLDIRRAMPDLKASETDMSHPIQSAEDVVEAASIAKKKIWAQYTAKLKQAGQRTNAETPDAMVSETPYAGAGGATIDGNKIADAMIASIDKRTVLQNPQLVERIKAIANTYRRPMSLDEAEDFLQSANNDLHSYYAKNKVGQQVAARDPETGHVVAEANALRNALYSKIDEVTGPGAADLKRRYGALTNVQDEAMRRVNVAARQNPQSLAEQLSMARAYGKIVVGAMRGSPGSVLEGTQSLAASKWLKERNTTDAMISRAFAKLGSQTPTAPARTGPGFSTPIAFTIRPIAANPSSQPNEATQ